MRFNVLGTLYLPRMIPVIKIPTWLRKRNLLFFSQGYCKYSIMFYGFYNDQRTIGLLKFRLPLSYLMVGIGSFGYSLMVVIRT